MAACCANWVRMTTRSSPSTHRKHKITACLIIGLPRCSVGRTKRSRTEHAALFTSRHSSFKALSQSHTHYLCASYFLLSPGLPSRCLARQSSPPEHEPLCQQEERSWEHAGCGSADGQRLTAEGCAGAGAELVLLHPHRHPHQHLPLSAGHSRGPAYLHRWESKTARAL